VTRVSLTLVLWLPKPPDNANGREHWAVANKAKRAYWDELYRRLQTGYHFPYAPAVAIQRATLSVEWFAERKQWMPDKDNITRRLKPVVDWLVANQWLAGDTADRVSWADHVVHPKRNGAPPLCTVRLTISSCETP
jgi:hypothetical protein